MLPDRVSNPGPLTYESGDLLIALRGPAGFIEAMYKVQERNVILTFDLATWFVFATNFLVMLIICAKLFSNPTMHEKDMSMTRRGFTETYA